MESVLWAFYVGLTSRLVGLKSSLVGLMSDQCYVPRGYVTAAIIACGYGTYGIYKSQNDMLQVAIQFPS